MNRITDKMRLDWLEKFKVGINPEYTYGREWRVGDSCSEFRSTIRKAIDAAMKAERKRK